MCRSTISWTRGRSAARRLTVNSPITARRAAACSAPSKLIIAGFRLRKLSRTDLSAPAIGKFSRRRSDENRRSASTARPSS